MLDLKNMKRRLKSFDVFVDVIGERGEEDSQMYSIKADNEEFARKAAIMMAKEDLDEDFDFKVVRAKISMVK